MSQHDDIPMDEPRDDLDERFADWVDGRLSPADAERLEAELDTDDELRDRVSGYQATVALLQRHLDEEPPVDLADGVMAQLGRSRSRRIIPFVASMAAAAAMISLVVILYRVSDRPNAFRPVDDVVSQEPTKAKALEGVDELDEAAEELTASPAKSQQPPRLDLPTAKRPAPDAAVKAEDSRQDRNKAGRLRSEDGAAARANRKATDPVRGPADQVPRPEQVDKSVAGKSFDELRKLAAQKSAGDAAPGKPVPEPGEEVQKELGKPRQSMRFMQDRQELAKLEKKQSAARRVAKAPPQTKAPQTKVSTPQTPAPTGPTSPGPAAPGAPAPSGPGAAKPLTGGPDPGRTLQGKNKPGGGFGRTPEPKTDPSRDQRNGTRQQAQAGESAPSDLLTQYAEILREVASIEQLLRRPVRPAPVGKAGAPTAPAERGRRGGGRGGAGDDGAKGAGDDGAKGAGDAKRAADEAERAAEKSMQTRRRARAFKQGGETAGVASKQLLAVADTPVLVIWVPSQAAALPKRKRGSKDVGRRQRFDDYASERRRDLSSNVVPPTPVPLGGLLAELKAPVRPKSTTRTPTGGYTSGLVAQDFQWVVGDEAYLVSGDSQQITGFFYTLRDYLAAVAPRDRDIADAKKKADSKAITGTRLLPLQMRRLGTAVALPGNLPVAGGRSAWRARIPGRLSFVLVLRRQP